MKARRTVLVTRFSALGDVALCIPPLYEACKANPSARFVMLTRKHPATLFVNAPSNLSVVGINTDEYKGIGGLIRLFDSLNSEWNITDMVDIHDVLRTKVLRIVARFKGVRVTVFDKGRRHKNALTRVNRKLLIPLISTTERYASAFSKAGFGFTETGAEEAERVRFQTLFSCGKPTPDMFASATAPKKDGEYWLAVAPFARHKGKIYPPELMARVVREFASRPNCKVFVFGFGTEEEKVIAGWAENYVNVVNMAALRIGMERELALLAWCDTMLSMDSANLHLASLVGLRAVSVWGATHPYTGFYGFNQKPEDAVQLDMTCRPCSVFGDKPCRRGDYHCLAGISPKMIVNRIDLM